MEFFVNPVFLLIEVLAIAITILLILSSPQTGSRLRYCASLLSFGVVIYLFFIEHTIRTGSIELIAFGILTFVFLAFTYTVGVHTVMRKKIFETVSHDQFSQYLSESKSILLFEKFLLRLGPTLFVFVVLAFLGAGVKTFFY